MPKIRVLTSFCHSFYIVLCESFMHLNMFCLDFLLDKGSGNRGARGAMAPLKIFLEGPGPSKITDDPSSAMNFYSTLYI